MINTIKFPFGLNSNSVCQTLREIADAIEQGEVVVQSSANNTKFEEGDFVHHEFTIKYCKKEI